MRQLVRLMTLFVVMSPACAQEQPMRIDCEMSMPKSFAIGQAAELTFTLINNSNEAVEVLNWHTPFEGIASEMFTVTRDGASVEYNGPMLKRAAPRKEHYLVLKPGEKKQAEIDLANGWDVQAPGKYVVKYSAQLFDVIATRTNAPRSLDEANPVELSCNSVTFTRVR